MPAFLDPPPTDVGSMPEFWASFNLAPRRIQDGGWGRQVTQADFAISSEIAGVNMRLSAGGIRELHWHQQAEWAIMTYGNCRITVLDAQGRPYVADVEEGDLWYFPAGLPHSLQGLGPDGAEFVLAFDNGVSSEFNTLLATDWLAHTPPEVLAKNFGVPAEALRDHPAAGPLDLPGQGAGSAGRCAKGGGRSTAGAPEYPFTFSLSEAPESAKTKRLPSDRRQLELPRLEDHRRGSRHDKAWRSADDALASERGRVAVLHQRHGPHDGVQRRAARPSQRTSTPATSAT